MSIGKALTRTVFPALLLLGCGGDEEINCAEGETLCGKTCEPTVSVDISGSVLQFLTADGDGNPLPASNLGELALELHTATFTGTEEMLALTVNQSEDPSFTFDGADVTCVTLALLYFIDDPAGSSTDLFANTASVFFGGRPSEDVDSTAFVLTKEMEGNLNTLLGRSAGNGLEAAGAVLLQVLDNDLPVAGATATSNDSAVVFEYPGLAGGDGSATDESGLIVISNGTLSSPEPNVQIVPPSGSGLSFGGAWAATPPGIINIAFAIAE